jgi:hypothetical protein
VIQQLLQSFIKTSNISKCNIQPVQDVACIGLSPSSKYDDNTPSCKNRSNVQIHRGSRRVWVMMARADSLYVQKYKIHVCSLQKVCRNISEHSSSFALCIVLFARAHTLGYTYFPAGSNEHLLVLYIYLPASHHLTLPHVTLASSYSNFHTFTA